MSDKVKPKEVEESTEEAVTEKVIEKPTEEIVEEAIEEVLEEIKEPKCPDCGGDTAIVTAEPKPEFICKICLKRTA